MLFVTKYTFKGDQSPASVKAMLEVFGEQGAAPGEIAHYVAADGRGGLVISENDSVTEIYENALHYMQWIDTQSVPAQTIEDALPTIMAVYS